MNWITIEGLWKEKMGAAHEQWGKITHDELAEVAGKREKLEGLIQQKYGISQDEAGKQIDLWAEKLKDVIGK